jgi:hypothetical protein
MVSRLGLFLEKRAKHLIFALNNWVLATLLPVVVISCLRLLMQAYESVRFAPQLLKKMSLEITQLEQHVEQSYEDQRLEVSRQ